MVFTSGYLVRDCDQKTLFSIHMNSCDEITIEFGSCDGRNFTQKLQYTHPTYSTQRCETSKDLSTQPDRTFRQNQNLQLINKSIQCEPQKIKNEVLKQKIISLLQKASDVLKDPREIGSSDKLTNFLALNTSLNTIVVEFNAYDTKNQTLFIQQLQQHFDEQVTSHADIDLSLLVTIQLVKKQPIISNAFLFLKFAKPIF